MKLESKRHKISIILKAVAAYFGLVFGAGFILGPIRIVFLVPRFGVRIAELMEAPVMLVVIIFAAKFVVRRFHTAPKLAVGLLALGLMVAIEFTLVLWLRGLTLTQYFRERDPVAGFVYYLMLVVFALMPFFIARKTSLAKMKHDSLHG
jgi:MFS family permease